MHESLSLQVENIQHELDKIKIEINAAENMIRRLIPFENKRDLESGRFFAKKANNLRKKECEVIRRQTSLILLLEEQKLKEK